MAGTKAEALKKAKKIRIMLLDVDGVMTDGRFLLDADGNEMKPFYSPDGVAIKALQQCGIVVGFITGRKSAAARARAKELGVKEVHIGKTDKLSTYEGILKKYDVSHSEVAYMGDDLPDLPLLRRVGLPATVPDAAPEVKKLALFTSTRPGGKGAVRDLAEFILKAQGKWKEVLKRFGE